MRRLGRFALLLTGVVLIATGLGQAQTVLTRQTRRAVQNGSAKLVGHMPANQMMPLVITLPLRNQQELDQFLKDVYDPSNALYRHFLTVDEFTAQFGPTQEDYDTLINFAEENGLTVTGTSRNRVNLNVSGTVGNVEKAFNVKLNVYQHPTEARTFYAPDRQPTTYLPFPLWHISGLDNYSIPSPAGLHKNPHPGTPSATTGSGPSNSFLGSDMRAAYYGGSLTGTGQSVGLLEYYGTDLDDVTTYYKNVKQTNSVPITLLSTDGTSTTCLYSAGCDDTEQTLDITQALGMAPGMSSLVMYVGSTDASIFNAMATASPLNSALSCSWAWRPADPATDDPYFQEFAAQGQNLFVASGDYGKWPSRTSPYYYPAEDAYITAVGGTDLTTSSAAGPWSSESAWADSGGGISPDHIAIPSWQATTASSCSNCSKTYRNAPDVSANANFTFYVCADQTTCTANLYGGTSFAAPMWAGYMALVNQQWVANGNQTGSNPVGVGFINPSLYSLGNSGNYPTDLRDITSGSNGYSATTGYDLATGWGSPNGAALINALAGAATPGFTLSASPSSLSVAQGSSNNSTTITSTVSGGFNSPVSLSATGQPSGVTIGFNPTSITGTGSSAMSITVGSSAAPGTYTITVTGAYGSTQETTAVSLTVTSSGSFTLSASPTSLSVAQGGSGSSTITSTVSGGFNSTVNLSASGQPSGVTIGFTPGSITGNGSSAMSITVGSSVATGTYTITVTGTSGTTTAATTVTLTVTSSSGGSFTLSAAPPSITVSRGGSGTVTIKALVTSGTISSVSLSASGVPSRVSASFSPSSINTSSGSGTSTMTIKANRKASSGNYTITVTGTGGGSTQFATVALTIQ